MKIKFAWGFVFIGILQMSLLHGATVPDLNVFSTIADRCMKKLLLFYNVDACFTKQEYEQVVRSMSYNFQPVFNDSCVAVHLGTDTMVHYGDGNKRLYEWTLNLVQIWDSGSCNKTQKKDKLNELDLLHHIIKPGGSEMERQDPTMLYSYYKIQEDIPGTEAIQIMSIARNVDQTQKVDEKLHQVFLLNQRQEMRVETLRGYLAAENGIALDKQKNSMSVQKNSTTESPDRKVESMSTGKSAALKFPVTGLWLGILCAILSYVTRCGVSL